MIKEVTNYMSDIAISKLIADEIFERVLQLINDEIRIARLELDEEVRDHRLSLLFPDNYPVDNRFRKLEELREKLITKKDVRLDLVCQYVLYHIIAVHSLVLKEISGTTIVPLENRDIINELIFARYGTLKDKYKYINFYEDYDFYTTLLFDKLDFLQLDDMSQEQIMELEENEKDDN